MVITQKRIKEVMAILKMPEVQLKIQNGTITIDDVFTNKEQMAAKWSSVQCIADEILSRVKFKYNRNRGTLYYFDKVWRQEKNDVKNHVSLIAREIAREDDYPEEEIRQESIKTELIFRAEDFPLGEGENIPGTKYSIYVFPNGTLYYNKKTGDWSFSETWNPDDNVREEENPPFEFEFVQNLDGIGHLFRVMSAWGPGLLKQLIYIISYALFVEKDFCQILYYLIGGGANGKSSFEELLTNIFPKSGVSALDISSLTGDKDGSQALEGAYINIGSEIKLNDFETKNFKKLIGGDLWSVNVKNEKERVNFVVNAKHIASSNNEPRLRDTTFGDIRRFLLIRFQKTFKKQDNFFANNIKPYIPQLFYFCLLLSKKIKEGGMFINPKFLGDTQHTIKEVSNTVYRFVGEFGIEYNPTVTNKQGNQGIDDRIVYRKYVAWCKDNGKSPYDKPRFSKEMDSALGANTKVANTRYNRYWDIKEIIDFQKIGGI